MRVVLADHADAALVPRDQLLDRWWTTTRLAETLYGQGVDVQFVGRTSGEAFTLERAGLTYEFVHDRTRALRRVARAVARRRADVVHVHGLMFAAATLAIRVCERRAAIVVQHHGERPPSTARGRVLQGLAGRVVDAHLFTGGVANAHGFAHGPVFEVLEASTDVVPVADRDAARRHTGVFGDPAVLWVGRLNDGKDPATAVDALLGLAACSPDAQLWVLCTHPPTLEARDALLAAAGPARDRVHLHDPVPHTEMPQWFAAADVALSTSRHEGSGYAVVEALACGCPVAATAIAPHRSILGPEAPTFAPGDVAGAVAALLRARAWPRDAVRADFVTRLSWPVVGARLVDVYATVAAGRARSRDERT